MYFCFKGSIYIYKAMWKKCVMCSYVVLHWMFMHSNFFMYWHKSLVDIVGWDFLFSVVVNSWILEFIWQFHFLLQICVDMFDVSYFVLLFAISFWFLCIKVLFFFFWMEAGRVYVSWCILFACIFVLHFDYSVWLCLLSISLNLVLSFFLFLCFALHQAYLYD